MHAWHRFPHDKPSKPGVYWVWYEQFSFETPRLREWTGTWWVGCQDYEDPSHWREFELPEPPEEDA